MFKKCNLQFVYKSSPPYYFCPQRVKHKHLWRLLFRGDCQVTHSIYLATSFARMGVTYGVTDINSSPKPPYLASLICELHLCAGVSLFTQPLSWPATQCYLQCGPTHGLSLARLPFRKSRSWRPCSAARPFGQGWEFPQHPSIQLSRTTGNLSPHLIGQKTVYFEGLCKYIYILDKKHLHSPKLYVPSSNRTKKCLIIGYKQKNSQIT